jgi:hypothetical protein
LHDDSSQTTTFDCSIALVFADPSQILVEGAIDPTHEGWSAPVTGGSGRYAGARGTVHTSSIHGKQQAERWSFALDR